MGGIDRVLIDPPREGALALARVLAATEKRPARVVYVSCNPATQARDLKTLTKKYKVTDIQPFDMFPHTRHVECVVLMSKVQK